MSSYTGTANMYPSFPEWGSSDPDIVLSCDCKSLASVTAATGAEVGAGSHTYDSGGVLLSATSGIKFTGLTTAQKTALTKGGTLTCWVEKGFIDGTRLPTSNEYLIGYINSTNYYSVLRQSGQYYLVPFLSNTVPSSGQQALANVTGKDDYVRIDLTSHGPTGKPTIYVDYFPFTYHTTKPWSTTSSDFTNIMLGGKPTSPTGPVSYRIKNVMVSTRPIWEPTSYSLGNIVVGGMSYMAQGDYPSTAYGCFVSEANGALYLGYDSVMIPTLHRELHKRGIGISGGRIRNHSYGGTVVRSATGGMAWQINTYKAHTTQFDTAILMWGANEIVESANTWASDFGPSGSIEDWETNFKALIDTMIAARCKRFLLINQPYLSENHPTASGQAYRDRVDGLNVMIQSVVDYINTTAASGYLVDLWTAMGGVNSSNHTLWGGIAGTDQAHPTISTQNMIGKLVANKLISVL